MTRPRISLPMLLWAFLSWGATLASPSAQAQESTSQHSDKLVTNSSSDDSKEVQARRAQNQTGGNANENGKSSAAAKIGVHNLRPSARQMKPAQSRQPHAANATAAELQTETFRSILTADQTRQPTMPPEATNKLLKHSSPPVATPTVALNGLQFRNSRDPGARMTTSGGLANSTRGTAALNGSEMKRRP
jgi:hypothetical protein